MYPPPAGTLAPPVFVTKIIKLVSSVACTMRANKLVLTPDEPSCGLIAAQTTTSVVFTWSQVIVPILYPVPAARVSPLEIVTATVPARTFCVTAKASPVTDPSAAPPAPSVVLAVPEVFVTDKPVVVTRLEAS